MKNGSVVWFNEPKGFGFIRDDENAEKIFVEFSVIEREGFRTLTEGERVTYTLAENTGGPKAARVVPQQNKHS
jgi:CspA family cold shock protein